MQSEPVQDPKGNIIAMIETDERGHAVLRRSEGEIIGYYEPDRDITRDKHFSPINVIHKINAAAFIVVRALMLFGKL